LFFTNQNILKQAQINGGVELNIENNKTRVVILTDHYQIRGEIAHFSGARLTDYMNESKAFIAVTDAEVLNYEGRQMITAPFLNVGLDKIEVIVPELDSKIG